MTESIEASRAVFEVYNKNKAKYDYSNRSHSEFLLFLMDATAKALSTVKSLSPLFEAALKQGAVQSEKSIPSPLPLDRTYDITSPKKSSITRPVLKDKANKSPAIIKDLNKEWGLKKENITKAKTFTFEPVSNQTFPAKSPRVVPGNTSSPSRRFFEKPKVGEVADEYRTCLTTPSPTEQVSNVLVSPTPPNCGESPLPTTEATVVQHAPLNFGKPHLEQLVSESTLRVIHSVMDPVEEGKSEKAQITAAETDKENVPYCKDEEDEDCDNSRVTDCGDKLCQFCPSYDEHAASLHSDEIASLTKESEIKAPIPCREMKVLHLSECLTDTALSADIQADKEDDLQNQTFYSWREWSTACAGDTTTVCASPAVLIPDRILALSDAELRAELIAKGAHPGPITPGTKKVYQEYLVKLGTQPINLNDSLDGYPRELISCLRGQPQPDYSLCELDMVQEFQNPVLSRNYRQGTKKCNFNYLLIDPRIANDLTKLSDSLHPVEVFKLFIKSVFYIGKARQSRPYGHLKEASQMAKDTPKLRKIRDIWSCGRGVVSLHVFSNTIAEEAFTREGVMISAIGMKKLTNEKQGEFYGVSKGWSPAKRRGVGVALLYKAYLTLLNEGHREIREDIR